VPESSIHRHDAPSRHADTPAAAGDAQALGTGAAGADLTEAELRHWASHYARQGADLAEAGTGAAHLICRIGGERFALPLADLDEIAHVQIGIGLSHTGPLVLGLVNIRGEVVPMLDTAAALGTQADYRLDSANRSLVIRDTRERRTALPVDRIESIELLSPTLFRAHGSDTQGPIRRVGIGEHAGGSLTLLDVGELRRAGAEASF
jgi:chemotaxis signal transduction protein